MSDTVIRKIAARRRRERAALLPPLTRPCRYCNGSGLMSNCEYDDWSARFAATLEQFEQDQAAGMHAPTATFYSSETWNKLSEQEPPAEVECGDCDGAGERLTDAGRQVLQLVRPIRR